MKNTLFKRALALALCLISLLLCACGGASKVESAPDGKELSAEEAYEAAVNTAEDSTCTDDECVVVLYDDDGELPYSVVSPVALARN